MPPYAAIVAAAIAVVDSGDADVDADEARRAAGGGDLGRDARALRLVDVGDHHARPFGGEPLGVGLADALPRAGDDRDLVSKPHAILLLSSRRERSGLTWMTSTCRPGGAVTACTTASATCVRRPSCRGGA